MAKRKRKPITPAKRREYKARYKAKLEKDPERLARVNDRKKEYNRAWRRKRNESIAQQNAEQQLVALQAAVVPRLEERKDLEDAAPPPQHRPVTKKAATVRQLSQTPEAKRKRKERAAGSPEVREARRAKDAARKRKERAAGSPEVREARRAKDAARKRVARARIKKDPESYAAYLAKNREWVAAYAKRRKKNPELLASRREYQAAWRERRAKEKVLQQFANAAAALTESLKRRS